MLGHGFDELDSDDNELDEALDEELTDDLDEAELNDEPDDVELNDELDEVELECLLDEGASILSDMTNLIIVPLKILSSALCDAGVCDKTIPGFDVDF